MSNGKGDAPRNCFSEAYRANYDRIFRCDQPRRQGNPAITVNQDTQACPECDASWVGSPIPAPYREYHGGATHYSLVLAVTDANADRVSHWRCPDCGKEWPA